MPDKRRTAPKTSDKQLDKASEIQAEDISRAQANWRRWLPAETKDILDAEPEGGTQ